MDENPSENILDFFSKIKKLNVMFVVYMHDELFIQNFVVPKFDYLFIFRISYNKFKSQKDIC